MVVLKLIFSCVWSLLVISLSIGAVAASKLPSFVKICHRHDPDLNNCARDSLNSLKERLHDGIPELHVPALEPLKIAEIKMNRDAGAVYMKSIYRNVHIYGLSDFRIKSLNIDPSEMEFTISVMFDNVTIEADYEIDGKIMMMPLMGSGSCSANFTDVAMTIVILGERQKRNDRNYLKIKDIKVGYDLGKVRLNLKDLFKGDKVMSDRVNAFLNENWDSLSEELKPLLQKSLTEVVHSSSDKFFKTYSFDDILPL